MSERLTPSRETSNACRSGAVARVFRRGLQYCARRYAVTPLVGPSITATTSMLRVSSARDDVQGRAADAQPLAASPPATVSAAVPDVPLSGSPLAVPAAPQPVAPLGLPPGPQPLGPPLGPQPAAPLAVPAEPAPAAIAPPLGAPLAVPPAPIAAPPVAASVPSDAADAPPPPDAVQSAFAPLFDGLP
jgi:hypothetical protein